MLCANITTFLSYGGHSEGPGDCFINKVLMGSKYRWSHACC